MPTRNINLTDHLDRFVEKTVDSGRYGNASEVIREGLRLLEHREEENRAKLKWLRGAVKKGLDQIERGEGIEFGSMADLEARVDELAAEVRVEKRRG
ncbi:MAG: type II toxin-antitoxin system ParD family antitoxin [Acidobacteria bacterium]|nr:type II toxin-antitoxin system ParD family antitoxin [Acidobacteriota bacterium]